MGLLLLPRATNITTALLVTSMVLLTTTINTCYAFISPTRRFVQHQKTSSQLPAVLPNSILQDHQAMLVATADSTSSDDAAAAAFTDSINYFDGTIGTMGIVFVVVVGVLAALKALGGQMDQAIEKVLVEFEVCMKRFYPQQWQEIEAKLEKTTTADERSAKLFEIMEQMEQDEPALMAQIKEKMVK
mmetsp:Transcript_15193/g.23316  ORF Transcript_15193/g.23316 Transcript_15193/m.23316 type:complete len:187 (+) Transcript_15193:93-653(+)